MINHVSFQGRFVKDPEVFTSQNRKKFAKFTIAWNESTKQDVKKCFLNCVSFDSSAEFVKKYFKKGQMTVVEGKLISNSYNDKEGNLKTNTELIVNQIHFCDAGKKENKYEEDDEVTPFI